MRVSLHSSAACLALPQHLHPPSLPTHLHIRNHVRAPDNEKRLGKKCRELNGEIVSNAAKVQTALRLSEEDQATIIALKREIEKAWKMVDASHEKVRVCLCVLLSVCDGAARIGRQSVEC